MGAWSPSNEQGNESENWKSDVVLGKVHKDETIHRCSTSKVYRIQLGEVNTTMYFLFTPRRPHCFHETREVLLLSSDSTWSGSTPAKGRSWAEAVLLRLAASLPPHGDKAFHRIHANDISTRLYIWIGQQGCVIIVPTQKYVEIYRYSTEVVQ